MNDFVDHMRAEVARLEEDIQKNPDRRVLRLDKLRDLIADYELPVPLTTKAVLRQLASAWIKPEFTPPPTGDRRLSKRELFRRETSELLKTQGLVHRTKILAHLTEMGVMGKEKDPIASLASYLSESKDIFAHDGKGGWYLQNMAPSTNEAEEADSTEHETNEDGEHGLADIFGRGGAA